MSELRRQQAERKRLDREGRATRRATGTVEAMVDATHAKVSLGDKTITALVPASVVAGVGARVEVRVGPTSVVESVLALTPAAGVVPLPDGRVWCFGSVTVTPTADVFTGVTWTFPVPLAAAPDAAGVTAKSDSSAVKNASFDSATPASMTVGVLRSNTTATVLSCWVIGIPA